MIKKIILTSCMIFSTSAIASANEGGQFYIKGNLGAGKLTHNLKPDFDEDYESDIKFKTKIAPIVDLGFGFKFNDQFSMDVTASGFFSNNMKNNTTTNLNDVDEIKLSNGMVIKNFSSASDTEELKVKLQIGTLMLNGYLTMPASETVTLFVGAGAGLSTIVEKVSQEDTTVTNGVIRFSDHFKETKVSKKPAFMGTIGMSLAVTPNVAIEPSYSYKDFGKGKYFKNRYSAHVGSIGLKIKF